MRQSDDDGGGDIALNSACDSVENGAGSKAWKARIAAYADKLNGGAITRHFAILYFVLSRQHIADVGCTDGMVK